MLEPIASGAPKVLEGDFHGIRVAACTRDNGVKTRVGFDVEHTESDEKISMPELAEVQVRKW